MLGDDVVVVVEDFLGGIKLGRKEEGCGGGERRLYVNGNVN